MWTCVFEIYERTDRHTDRQADCNTSYPYKDQSKRKKKVDEGTERWIDNVEEVYVLQGRRKQRTFIIHWVAFSPSIRSLLIKGKDGTRLSLTRAAYQEACYDTLHQQWRRRGAELHGASFPCTIQPPSRCRSADACTGSRRRRKDRSRSANISIWQTLVHTLITVTPTRGLIKPYHTGSQIRHVTSEISGGLEGRRAESAPRHRHEKA